METIVIGKVAPSDFNFVVKDCRNKLGEPRYKYEFQVALKRFTFSPEAVICMDLEMTKFNDGKLTIYTPAFVYVINAPASYSAGIVACYEHWMSR